MSALVYRPYFFDTGIRFQCRKCGACCTGEPGIIHVEPAEIDRIARFMGIGISEFERGFLSAYKHGYTICEHEDGRCFFYDSGCKIYEVRPEQCRLFPFWFSLLRSEKKWRAVSKTCIGIGEGRLYTKTEILEKLKSAMTNQENLHP